MVTSARAVFGRILAALLLLCVPAAAQTPIYAPTTITASGSYYLGNSLIVTSGCNNGIIIAASFVKLNLNGFEIKCTAPVASGSSPIGVLIASNANYAEVYGGSISGWQFGVYGASDAYSSFVHDMNITATNIGVALSGDYSRIRNTTASNIGGRSDTGYAVCFALGGDNAQIMWSACQNAYRQALAAPGVIGEGVGFLVSSGAANSYLQYNTALNGVIEAGNIAVWIGDSTGHNVGFTQARNFNIGMQGGARGTFTRNAFWMSSVVTGTVGVSMVYPQDVVDNLVANYASPGVSSSTNTVLP